MMYPFRGAVVNWPLEGGGGAAEGSSLQSPGECQSSGKPVPLDCDLHEGLPVLPSPQGLGGWSQLAAGIPLPWGVRLW